MKEYSGDLIVLTLYVKDMLVTRELKISDFKMNLRSSFEMSNLGLVHNYLGVYLMQTKEHIYFLQSKYIL